MDGIGEWKDELFAVVASATELRELAPVEIGIEVSGERFGLNLAAGRVTDGVAARSWVIGTGEVFSQLVSGAITLQRAHVTGRIKLSGSPEELLKVAFLFDMLDARGEKRKSRASTDTVDGVSG